MVGGPLTPWLSTWTRGWDDVRNVSFWCFLDTLPTGTCKVRSRLQKLDQNIWEFSGLSHYFGQSCQLRIKNPPFFPLFSHISHCLPLVNSRSYHPKPMLVAEPRQWRTSLRSSDGHLAVTGREVAIEKHRMNKFNHLSHASYIYIYIYSCHRYHTYMINIDEWYNDILSCQYNLFATTLTMKLQLGSWQECFSHPT